MHNPCLNEGQYRFQPYAFNGKNTTSGYQYPSFTMELLPHELRYLLDGNVVARMPDRLIPTTSKYFNYNSWIPRSPVGLQPAETDIDYDLSDPMGTRLGSITYQKRQYFETHLGNPGMRDVTIGGTTYHAAHHLIDYVKVWDLPDEMSVAPYPH